MRDLRQGAIQDSGGNFRPTGRLKRLVDRIPRRRPVADNLAQVDQFVRWVSNSPNLYSLPPLGLLAVILLLLPKMSARNSISVLQVDSIGLQIASEGADQSLTIGSD